MPIALVDLDNIYIINNKVNVPKLKRRIQVVKDSLNMPIVYFGNEFTKRILLENEIKVKMTTTPVLKDSADHSLISKINSLVKKHKEAHIITADVSLGNLAYFIAEKPDNLIFHRFLKSDKLEEYDVMKYCFKNKRTLQKFLDSYNLYKSRFVTK